LEDTNSRLNALNASINKLEKAKRRAEADYRTAKKQLSDLEKKKAVKMLLELILKVKFAVLNSVLQMNKIVPLMLNLIEGVLKLKLIN